VFDINGGEMLLLLLIAVLVIGPKRLPKYAEQLGQWARRARRFAQDAKARVDEELGDEVKDVDWTSLDPRKYDPRRIVREALLDDPPTTPPPPGRPPTKPVSARPRPAPSASATGAAAAAAVGGGAAGASAGSAPTPAPFDDEAT